MLIVALAAFAAVGVLTAHGTFVTTPGALRFEQLCYSGIYIIQTGRIRRTRKQEGDQPDEI
jgi:hypothetical protein